ncbi:MAG: aminopeptidase [Chitinivibrionales bacterium]|nr:aminopeptidase [Chitinivibrionales bacterium]
MKTLFRRDLRKFRFVIGLACLFFIVNGCYLFKQGHYILSYGVAAVPIQKLAQSPDTPDSLKRFLALVLQIRQYAADSIGLKQNNNYTTFVRIPKSYLVDVVSAAGKADFTLYQWCYPFFGCFPYKGFFERRDAKQESARLAAAGYDVFIGRVDAFSTLGFFSDPVYSFMENFSVYEIAGLIIHEQTHATLFIKNQIQFNEELATFVGDQGALGFIRAQYGDSSRQYRDAQKYVADEETCRRLIHALYLTLKNVYDSNTPSDNKIAQKQRTITAFKDSLARNYDAIFQTPSFKGLSKAPINNAYLGIENTYTLDLQLFYDYYKKENRDLRAMLKSLKKLAGKKGPLPANMRAAISVP